MQYEWLGMEAAAVMYARLTRFSRGAQLQRVPTHGSPTVVRMRASSRFHVVAMVAALLIAAGHAGQTPFQFGDALIIVGMVVIAGSQAFALWRARGIRWKWSRR